MERYSEALVFLKRELPIFLEREWPILLGIALLLVGLRWALRMRARVRAGDDDLDNDCPKCPGKLHPDGLFPGGSVTEVCDRCGNVRLWVIEDGNVPRPEDHTAEEWKAKDHGPKVRQGQVRGREWGNIGVSPGSGE